MSDEEGLSLISHKEAADMLGIKVHRIEKWLYQGLIPYAQIGKKKQLDKKSLLEWYKGQIVYPKIGVRHGE